METRWKRTTSQAKRQIRGTQPAQPKPKPYGRFITWAKIYLLSTPGARGTTAVKERVQVQEQVPSNLAVEVKQIRRRPWHGRLVAVKKERKFYRNYTELR